MRPLIDLHLDLEGSAPPALIRSLARAQGNDISGLFDANGAFRPPADMAGFRKALAAASAQLRGPQAFYDLTQIVAERAAEAGVIYAELRLQPLHCGGGDLLAWRDHLAAISDAAARAQEAGLTLRLIPLAARQLGPDAARRAAICAAETAGAMVVGFALGGDPDAAPAADFAWSFDCVREAGLKTSLGIGPDHAPATITKDRAALHPDRIAGARRLAENPALVETLADARVAVEQTPGDDLYLRYVRVWRTHPMGALYDRGARMVVASGHSAWTGYALPAINERLSGAFDWDEGVFDRLTQTALDAAFCDGETRETIAKLLEARHA